MTALSEVTDDLRAWLFNHALPLWRTAGADYENGGFQELLDWEGRPVAAPRRARVQARQVYVYAVAGAMGWTGPWRAAMDHGLDFLFTRYFRPDGLVRPLVSPTGKPIDGEIRLYDQAFALFALAAAAKVRPEDAGLRDRAHIMLGAIKGHFDFGGLGFRELDPARPFQSNPHMHLLEASLAWAEIDPDPLWSNLADAMASLALGHFIDGEMGGLREFFDDQWRPAEGSDGRVVEPGHQFEWAWLLLRWAALRGRADARAAGRRLFEIGAGPGLDRTRNVAINALDDSFAPLDTVARLWPQTERIKAAILVREAAAPADQDRLARDIVHGVAGLRQYLSPMGTWRDRLGADGVFIDEPAPASSFYHIICAIAELRRHVLALDSGG
jgi:mannose/cellobiose epimerase-like protein (N-acyl-D-glucosamine 2-epimerase family)